MPGHGLLAQLRLAEAGHAMVVGSVRPERRGLDPHLWRAWHERHRAREGHPHVHGANLGLSLDAYLQVGGVPAVPLHEDVLLVEAVRRSGLPWCATDTTRVTTSSRRSGRLAGGFADYLDGLGDPAATPETTPPRLKRGKRHAARESRSGAPTRYKGHGPRGV